MAAAQVQHAAPTAVHDGDCCFQKEENHKAVAIVVQDTSTAKVEEAARAEQMKVHNSDESKEETKGHGEDSMEEKGHEEEESAVATDAVVDDGLLQAVAQEVEAKLDIVQDDVDVKPAAADAEANKKSPREEERRREVTKKASAKAVVVPVDDDELELETEVAAPAEAASEAPEKEREEEGATSEEAKAHEE